MGTDRETERQRDRETDRQRDRETERQRDRQTDRQRDTDNGRTDGRTDRQTASWAQIRLATSVCRPRPDPMEQGPTEPHAGRSTFLLSCGGAGGGYY